jgi:glycosyltransferase involved in cell wall biosynthesis
VRIVQVTPRFPPAIGGMENHVYAISTELKKRGHKVMVITSDDVGEDRKGIVKCLEIMDGVEVYRRPLLFRKRMRECWFLSDVTALLSKLKADVVHAHSYRCLSSCIATYWCRRNKIPVVLTPHGIYPPRSLTNHLVKTVYDHSFGNLLLRSSGKIVALTEHNKHLLLKLGALEDRIVLIPNGVNVNRYDKTRLCNEKMSREEFGDPVLLYVGRVDWNKGLERVIEAMPALVKSFSHVKFLIVGPDWSGHGEKLWALASKLGVSESVVMTGEVSEEEKLSYYSVADVFVLPTMYEGLSLSLLEAMASGLPIVVTKSGGPGDILADGVHALLMNDCSAREISGLVSMILADSRLAKRIGRNAFELVSKGFSWDRVVNKIEALYSELNIGN